MKSLRTAEPSRGPHYFDTRKEGRKVTRTLRNWSSFKLPGQDWEESKNIIEAGSASVRDLAPMKKHEKASLQSYVGNARDADYQCAASVRLSDDPNVSIDMRPIDALSSRLVQLPDNVIKFPGVWQHATKLYQPCPDKLLGTLRLERPGHSAKFRYSLDVPDGMRIVFADNAARILDDQGAERLHILAPMGWDSSTVNPETPDGRKPVRVTMREAGTIRVGGRDCIVVELEPNKNDLEGATYPVEIKRNPTVQITGTTDIEDNYIYENLPTNNYGNATTLFMRPPGNEQRILLRISAGSIPAGNITGFRLFSYSPYNTAGTIYAYFVADANDWPEGNGTQPGNSCWQQCKKDVQSWAGQQGCYLSGTDYDADGDPPSMIFDGTYNKWRQFDLKPEWPPLWRDLARTANGLIFNIPTAGQQYRMQSTEHGIYPLYFEIDWAPAAGGAAQRWFMMGGQG